MNKFFLTCLFAMPFVVVVITAVILFGNDKKCVGMLKSVEECTLVTKVVYSTSPLFTDKFEYTEKYLTVKTSNGDTYISTKNQRFTEPKDKICYVVRYASGKCLYIGDNPAIELKPE